MTLQASFDAAERQVMRLDVLRPLLRGALAALWIGSGLAALRQQSWLLEHLAERAGLGAAAARAAFLVACLAQVAIGAALLLRWRPPLMMRVQIALIGAYMLALTATLPSLWLKPFSPLLTGLPVLVAIILLATVERPR